MTLEFARIEKTLGGGVLGVAAEFEGEAVLYNEAVSFPTASCIKIAIVEEIFRQDLDLARSVTLLAEDFVGGSGVLSSLTPPVTLPLGDLATLTLSISDNTASNACLKAVGGADAVNARLRTFGLVQTTIHRPIKFSLEPTDPPHTATGTPAEFLTLLGHLSEGTRKKMALCTDDAMLPRFLDVNPFASDLSADVPPFTVVHKPGAVTGVRNDVGWISRNGKTLALAVFTKNAPDPRWTPENAGCVAVGRVAELLAERFFGA